MSERFTRRNHYNPCFWTALWNESYFAKFCSGNEKGESARQQNVYALNLRADKILPTKVETIHYQKDLGVAEITPASWRNFCVRRGLTEHDDLRANQNELSTGLYLDFEDILNGVETAAKYSCLMKAARLGGLESLEHKGFLIGTLMIHAMRSYEFMTVAIDEMDSLGVAKWEYFVDLRHTWSDPEALMRAVLVPSLGEWTFWRSDRHAFPLCDSPVMIGRDSIMAVLSPRLLLEINLNVRRDSPVWIAKDEMPADKYSEFRRRSIRNAFKEIIFHDASVLADWQLLEQCKDRVAALGDPRRRQVCLWEAAERVKFGVNGFGRVSNG